MIDNLFTLKGTLYAKETRKVANKKKPTEPDYEFFSIKVETNILIGGRTITAIPELSLDRGVSFEEFSVGDHIEVDFYLTGKKISDTWYKSEAKAVYIKFSDITSPPKPKKTGKELVPSMSDINTIADPPKIDDTFVGARPQRPNIDPQDDEFKDLPFIITALIGISTLLPLMI